MAQPGFSMEDLAGMEDVPIEDPPSSHSSDEEWEHVDQRFDAPNTPSSTSEDAPKNFDYGIPSGTPATHDDEPEEVVPRRKPGGYESRIEQFLYENPDQPVLITDAGKSPESGGKYIVYTIRTGVRAFPPPFHCKT